jgi:hypothetical protein
MSKKKDLAPEATRALAPRDPNVALEAWELELAEEAQKAKETVADLGGNLVASIKGGKLTIGDTVIASGQLACVVVAHTASKAYYAEAYNPKQEGATPVCFGFGPKLSGIFPHAECSERQAEACDKCKWNEFGTARQGNGKACRDSIRVAFVEDGAVQPNGVFIPYTDNAADLARLEKNDVVTLSVPPTSLNNFAKYLRCIADTEQRPLYGVHTLIKVALNDDDYPMVTFENLGLVTKAQLAVLRRRGMAAMPVLVRPYPKMSAKAEKGGKDKGDDTSEEETSGKASSGGKKRGKDKF